MVLLTGDGKLMTGVKAVAAQNQLNISIKLLADNFSLIAEAIQNCRYATVLPTPAAASLSRERFAIINLKGMDALRRELSLVYNSRIVGIRASIKRVAERIARSLKG